MAKIGEEIKEEKTKKGPPPPPTKVPERIPAPEIFRPRPVGAPTPVERPAKRESVPV